MKKLVLAFVAFVSLIGVQAQNPITPIDCSVKGFWHHIPRIFCNDALIFSTNGEEFNYDIDTLFVINSNLQIEKTIPLNLGVRNNRPIGPVGINFYNYDADIMYDDVRLYISQTLFNNDNKFEFIKPVFSSSSTSYEYNLERLEVLSDDGTIVNTITWDDGYLADGYINMFKFGNNIYMCVFINNGNISKRAWYRIDRQSQNISRVENVPFNVFPTVADRNSEITVQLEEGTNAREIVVIDAMGREVKSVPVAQGQQEVKINTSGLGTGMGFVSDRKNSAVKIIVR